MLLDCYLCCKLEESNDMYVLCVCVYMSCITVLCEKPGFHPWEKCILSLGSHYFYGFSSSVSLRYC